MSEPNNVQFSIEAEDTFSPDDLPSADASVMRTIFTEGHRTYQPFTPQRAELTEIVTATYRRDSDDSEITLHETISDGADILLVQAFVGFYNCFPHAPTYANGIPGPALGRIGNLNWPAWNADQKLSLGFAIERSILSRARGTCQHCGEPSGHLPDGYNPIPKSIKVQVRLTLSGPVVRS